MWNINKANGLEVPNFQTLRTYGLYEREKEVGICLSHQPSPSMYVCVQFILGLCIYLPVSFDLLWSAFSHHSAHLPTNIINDCLKPKRKIHLSKLRNTQHGTYWLA